MKYFSLNVRVILWYLLATIVLTHPLIFNLSDSIYGIPHDNFGTLWDLWAYNKSFQNDTPFNSYDYVNYPFGISIVPSLQMYIPLVRNILFGYIIPNPFLAYNIIMLLKLVLAAFFMFLLLRKIQITILLAWFGGCLYAFNPFMSSLALAYGPNYISLFLPILSLSIINFIQSINFKNFAVLIIVAFLLFGENYYYSYFAFVSTAITSILYLFLHSSILYRRLTSFTINKNYFELLIMVLFSLLLLSLCLLLLVYLRKYFILLGNSYSISDAMRMAARPIFYFIPTINNPFLGDLFIDYYWSKMKPTMDTFELSIYLGYTLLLTSILGCLRFTSLPRMTQKYFLWFASMFCVSIILALGPMLPNTWDGMSPENNLTIKNIGYYFFELAPMFRHQTRYHLITSFSLIICFIISLNFLVIKKLYFNKKLITISFVMLLVFFEYSTYSYSNTFIIKDNMPKVYTYLQKQHSDFAIAEWPNNWWRILSTYASFQVIHQKKRYTSVNSDLRSVDVQGKLHELGIDYFVFNRKLSSITSFPMSPQTHDFGYKNFYAYHTFGKLVRVDQWDDSILYKYNDENVEIFSTEFTHGFDLQSDQNSALKWTNSNVSQLNITSNKSYSEIFLIFTARSLEPKQLEFILNDKMQGLIFVKPGKAVFHSIKLVDINEGKNILEIRNKDGLSSIESILNIPDHRNVGIFIGNFTFSHFRLSLKNGFCNSVISINNTPRLCDFSTAIGIDNLYGRKDLTLSFESERTLNISEIQNYKSVKNEEILNLKTKLVKIRLFDIEHGKHKIYLRFSKIDKGKVKNDKPVALSNPIQISSLELTEHK